MLTGHLDFQELVDDKSLWASAHQSVAANRSKLNGADGGGSTAGRARSLRPLTFSAAAPDALFGGSLFPDWVSLLE